MRSQMRICTHNAIGKHRCAANESRCTQADLSRSTSIHSDSIKHAIKDNMSIFGSLCSRPCAHTDGRVRNMTSMGSPLKSHEVHNIAETVSFWLLVIRLMHHKQHSVDLDERRCPRSWDGSAASELVSKQASLPRFAWDQGMITGCEFSLFPLCPDSSVEWASIQSKLQRRPLTAGRWGRNTMSGHASLPGSKTTQGRVKGYMDVWSAESSTHHC